jgi:anti-anti-sigma regulatory factor
MDTKIKTINDILLIELPNTYSVFTIEEIMKLVNSVDKYKNINNILVNCSNLKSLDNFGGEIFLLKKNMKLKNFAFIGVNRPLKPIMDNFSQRWFKENITVYDTYDEAISKITM